MDSWPWWVLAFLVVPWALLGLFAGFIFWFWWGIFQAWRK